jgi:PAS domain S-box-containing protein
VLLIIVPPIIFLYFSWNTNLIEYHTPETIVRTLWGISSPASTYFYVFLIWFETVMMASVIILIKFFMRTNNSLKRKQAFWIIASTIIPLTIGSISDGFLPAFGKTNIMPMGIPLTSVMGIIITYAVLKHDLFEFSPTSIISSIGEGIISIDSKGRIIFANEPALRMLKLEYKSILGKFYYEIVKLRGEDGKLITLKERPFEEALQNKISTVGNYYVSSKRITKMPVAMSVKPLVKNKKSIGATVTFRDVTKEKETETNKDEFISVASHELKTPITALKLYTSHLERQLEKKGDMSSLSALSKINYQTDRLIVLVGSLLNVSKIKTGKYTYNMSKFSAESVVKDAILTTRPLLRGRRLKVKAKSKTVLYGDKEKLAQILTNFITNAIKYSKREIVISISEDEKSVTYKVKDYGQGIKPAEVRKLFERYYRSKKDEFTQGFGIGLYVSREYVIAHKGKIWVESVPGKGSTFSFSIPKPA